MNVDHSWAKNAKSVEFLWFCWHYSASSQRPRNNSRRTQQNPRSSPQPPKALNDHSIQPRCQHHHHHFACLIRQRPFISAKKGSFLFKLAKQTLLRRSPWLCDDKKISKGVSLDGYIQESQRMQRSFNIAASQASVTRDAKVSSSYARNFWGCLRICKTARLPLHGPVGGMEDNDGFCYLPPPLTQIACGWHSVQQRTEEVTKT